MSVGRAKLELQVLFVDAGHVVAKPTGATSLTQLKQHLSWVATWLHHEAGLRGGRFASHDAFVFELQHPCHRHAVRLQSNGLRFMGWNYAVDLQRHSAP